MAEPPPLKPLEGWSAAVRGRFETDHGGHSWIVDVNFLDLDERINLYRDGEPVEAQKSPASFDLGDGAGIEASMNALGMKRIDLVAEGEATHLTPVDGTLEAWRVRFDRERPRLSRTIGAISWVVLVIALVASLAELIALTGNEIDLPLVNSALFNTVIGFAALAAALERALRFKTNRWLD